jgi:hypothetical protein
LKAQILISTGELLKKAVLGWVFRALRDRRRRKNCET